MIHRYTLKGVHFILDTNSGAVHIVDDAAFAVSGLLTSVMSPECPPRIFQSLSHLPREEVRGAYAELYGLYVNGQLFSGDDYFAAGKYVPIGAPVKALCLHVSHDCNLRCAYCFAATGDFGTGRKTMPFEVAKQAVDFVVQRSGGRKNIEIDFFGGEPLMAFDTVTRTVDYARSLEAKTGKHFRFTITTNGLLLDEEKIRYINEHMDNVVLSLDGRKEVNDAMRKTVSGEGSYEWIVPKYRALVAQRDPGRDYYVRGTFTSQNLDFAEDVMAIAAEGFERLSVEPVTGGEDGGFGLTEADLPAIFAEYERLVDCILEQRRKGRTLSFFHFMVDLDQGPCVIKRLRGCGAGYEYVAVTPEGDIYPCHQFVGKPEFRQGSVLDGTLDEGIARRFAEMNIYTRKKCRSCWAKFYCSGGCSAANFNQNADLNEPYALGCEMERKRLECAIYLKAVEAGGANFVAPDKS